MTDDLKRKRALARQAQLRAAGVPSAPGIPDPVQPKLTLSSQAQDAARLVAQGVLSVQEGAALGFGPEMIAGLQTARGAAGVGEQRPFQENLQAIEQTLSESPNLRLAGNVAGGIGTGLGAARAAPAAFSTVPRVAGASAAEGAIAGAGFADPGERLEGAAIGGTIGAGLGLILPFAASKVRNGFARLTNRLPGDRRFAANRILQELDDNRITPEEALRRVRDLGGDAALADIPELQGLAQAAGSQPGQARNIASAAIEGRQAGAEDRILGAVRKIISAEDFGSFRRNLLDARQQQANQLYGEFRAGDVLEETPELRKLIGSITEIGKDGRLVRKGGSNLVMRLVNKVKGNNPELRGLSDLDPRVLDAAYKDLPFQEGGKGFQANAVRNQLKDAISAQRPIFRTANDTFSGSKAMEEALDQGRKTLTRDDFLTKDMIEAMTEGEKEAFIVGVARSATDKVLGGGPTTNVAQRLFNSRTSPKIRAAFPDKESFRAFKRVLQRELSFAESARATSPVRGSRTTPLAEGQSALETATRLQRAVQSLQRGNILEAGGQLLTSGRRPALAPGRAEALSRGLFESQQPGLGGTNPLQDLITQQRLQQVQSQIPLAGQIAPSASIAGEQSARRERAQRLLP